MKHKIIVGEKNTFSETHFRSTWNRFKEMERYNHFSQKALTQFYQPKLNKIEQLF